MREVKIRYFTIADYEEEEIWLREQHKKGLRLEKIYLPCFYVFAECPPEDVIYRLDYQNREQTADYMQLFRDYGWEYFTSCNGWLYFRKPASQVEKENDGEIFSDRQSKLQMIQHVIQTRLVPIFVVVFCLLLPNWYNCLFGDLSALGWGFGIFFTVVFLLCLGLLIYCGCKLRRLKNRYKTK